MELIMRTIILLALLVASVRGQWVYGGQLAKQPITDPNPTSASYEMYRTVIEPNCINRVTTTGSRVFPTGQSIENFIALVETLEQLIYNNTDADLQQHMGADNVAKLLLRRFRFDGFDPQAGPIYKRFRDRNMEDIANAFLSKSTGGQLPTSYNFPDAFFKQEELCSLHSMLSHNIYNINDKPRTEYSSVFRGKRQTYNNRGSGYQNQNRQNVYQNQNQNQRQYGNYQRADTNIYPSGSNNYNMPVASNYLTNYTTGTQRVYHPIKEEGVVSFRAGSTEAIQISRVLIGVIAGLATDIKHNVQDVLQVFGKGDPQDSKEIDPVAAMTIADLWGSGSTSLDEENDYKSYFWGVNGQWASGYCTTHYGLTSIPASLLQTPDKYKSTINAIRATKAEIRGGIDGYLIGTNLASIRIDDPRRLLLSTILRSYYGKPLGGKSTSLTVSYCDRMRVTGQDSNKIQDAANGYQTIQSKRLGTPVSSLDQSFSSALSNAAQQETGGSEYCNRPGGQSDKSAPCETPSDVIYVIDASDGTKLQKSAEIVAQVNANLNNIRAYGGVVNIFLNSKGRNDINSNVVLPQGDWPLVAVAFNSTNAGCSQCRIDDFNTSSRAAVQNTGQYFKALNTTLFNYEWWTPRTNDSAIPAKSAVLIDFTLSTMPDSGPDRDDYNYFKDQLRYRHRDVRFLGVSQTSDLFKDILRYEDDKATPGNAQQIGVDLAKKICDNPATFQYNACNDRRSDGVTYTGYITPGYKQNWAMYPEFFLKSFNIRFSIKPEDGDMRVCFDRKFPPEDPQQCKDLKNGEEQYFEISNPCKGRSFSSCDPFYFTMWGITRTAVTQCLDPKCMNLEQIKFTVTHTGVQCSSSHNIMPSTLFQLTSLITVFIIYLFYNK